MEITERELDRLVRAVDETHREGMDTMAADVDTFRGPRLLRRHQVQASYK